MQLGGVRKDRICFRFAAGAVGRGEFKLALTRRYTGNLIERANPRAPAGRGRIATSYAPQALRMRGDRLDIASADVLDDLQEAGALEDRQCSLPADE